MSTNLDELPTVSRMRHRISRLWTRKSKHFQGFSRVMLYTHMPEARFEEATGMTYPGDESTWINYAIIDSNGDHVMRERDFERPGRNPAWQNLELRKLYHKLPFDIRHRPPGEIVKIWQGDTPDCIQPFYF